MKRQNQVPAHAVRLYEAILRQPLLRIPTRLSRDRCRAPGALWSDVVPGAEDASTSASRRVPWARFMKTETRKVGDVVVLDVSGRVDAAAAVAFDAVIATAHQAE